MKIVVLAGGYSPERDVSLSSGSLIANSLMRSGHSVLLVDAFLGLEIPQNEELDSMFRRAGDEEYSYRIEQIAPDMEELKKKAYHGSLVGKNVLTLCHHADLVFMALHGAMGENGQMQAILETENIRFTGSTHVGCVLAMDKDITKKLLKTEGIPTADWITLDLKQDRLPSSVALPCVVKPCSCGSSVGISIVHTEEELKQALEEAKKYEDLILIEKKISGREFSVGVLDGTALPPIEIIPKTGFYDYKNKYQAGATEEICPASLTEAELEQVQALAERVARVLRLGCYCRIDFILEQNQGIFYCLEANTLPGMTPSSLLPQEAAAAGIGYDALCQRIVDLALPAGTV
ncbi:MAG: D-alanine--D-alanine ligase [Clostridia bacterium]|nr:D-alanine--D-alanine ligase [Clostridia bacterium]